MQERWFDVCDTCGKTAMEAGRKVLLQCGGCTISPQYCSPACQKESWQGHKKDCRKNSVGIA